jgi:hypothetical protein
MRTKLALAGLVAGLAALAPVAPASAQCDPDPTLSAGATRSCSNSCTETGNAWEKVRGNLADKGIGGVPSYWDLFACTQ